MEERQEEGNRGAARPFIRVPVVYQVLPSFVVSCSSLSLITC